MMVVIEARIPEFPDLIPKLTVSQLAYASHIMCIVTIWQPEKKNHVTLKTTIMWVTCRNSQDVI